MLAKRIGIDLGTSSVRIFVRGEGVVVDEPSLVAVNRDGTRILALGRQAVEMAGRTAGAIRLVRPMSDGAIADLSMTEAMLHHLIWRVLGRSRLFKPEVMICVPAGVTGVERRAVTEAAISAGARQAWLIDDPLAAAIGAGLPIGEARGTAVCEIGAGTTEVAVISLSGMVVADSVPMSGHRLDEAVVEVLKRRHGVLIDERTAERVKIAVGAATPLPEARSVEVKGRDIESGLPSSLVVTSQEVEDAIQVPLGRLVGAIRDVLQQTPPELAADVQERGIVLSGGGALLRGLDRFITARTGIPAMVAEDPHTCVVRGAGAALDRFEVLRRNQLPLR